MEKISLSSIFSKIDVQKEQLYEIVTGWNFDNIESFILSFEKLSQKDNIHHSKKYGNIAKSMAKDILDEDIGSFDLMSSKKYSDKEILEMVNSNKKLSQKFSLLFEEISKRNQWKLEMPVLSLKYDLFLDRLKNDYERFKIIYNFYKKNEPINVRNVENEKKTRISYDELNRHESNEIEKIFYILLNKIRRKRDGESFLKKFADLD